MASPLNFKSNGSSWVKAPLHAHIFMAIVFVLAIGLPVAAFLDWLDLPYVYMSAETGECVRVEDPAASKLDRQPWTCDRLPKRYETIWVR